MTTPIVLAVVALLLVFLLLRMRRRRSETEQVEINGGSGRRGFFRRNKEDADAVTPAPMPLAAAVDESAATGTVAAEPLEAAPDFPAVEPFEAHDATAHADDPDLGAIPGLEELAATPSAAEPVAAQGDEPTAPPPSELVWPAPSDAALDSDEDLVQPEDDIINQPGWPAPGEVGTAWSTDEPLAPEPQVEEIQTNGGPPPEEVAPWQPAPADPGFDPATGWAPPAPVGTPEPTLEPLAMPEGPAPVVEPLGTREGPEVTPFPAAAIPIPGSHDIPAEAPVESVAATGRFALGGYALQPGQQAVSGVTFPQPVPWAPEGWTHAPDQGPARTIVLEVNGTINCDPTDVEVIAEPGFAPTQQGFTLRLSARAPGPFMASGTFRLA